MSKRLLVISLFALVALCLMGFVIYNLPPVNSRLAWRVDALLAQIKYTLNPPDEAVFVPQQQDDPAATPTLAATPTPLPPTPTIIPTGSPQPSATPTLTATPLPESVILDGVVYVDQHGRWNYCGPANLTMALKFWGWPGDRDDVAAVVKPGIADPNLDFIQRGKLDKNVMPYEMANFVSDQTDFSIVTRSGGDIELVKRLIAAGFPVLVEKGYYEADYTGKVAWLGHYLYTTGYDEQSGEFVVQDAYLKPGKDMRVDYQTYKDGWRSFNYLFMVVYPPEREAEVYAILGPWADPAWAYHHALEIAEEEKDTLTGIDQFFAWFNKGSSHVGLTQYPEAGAAYDQAFKLYSELGDDDTQRPYRILWYQTGPYWAYFYTGRYQDTINLANTTLNDTISEPTLEESLYWRGQASLALGQTQAAIDDFRETVRLNPNFGPGLDALAQLGVSP
jgi:tetratricopeptide (TPR) repeat protein